MLRLVWTQGANCPPLNDDRTVNEDYTNAVDTLDVSFGASSGRLRIKRGADDPDGVETIKPAIRAWLAEKAKNQRPITLMIHGFMYDPRDGDDSDNSPFHTAYKYPDGQVNSRLSWLPLVGECDDSLDRPCDPGNNRETAIAFAWVSDPGAQESSDAGWSQFYQYAYFDLADLAARALSMFIKVFVQETTDRFSVMAHSLGTRVFTRLLDYLDTDTGMIANTVLLDGAQYCVEAVRSYAGCALDIVNITNGTDIVLQDIAEIGGEFGRMPGEPVSYTIGRYGLGLHTGWPVGKEFPPNWVDIALDRDDVVAWFAANGHYTITKDDHISAENPAPIHDGGERNHWACYTEIGNRALIVALIGQPKLNLRTPGFPAGTSQTEVPNFWQIEPLQPLESRAERQHDIVGGYNPNNGN